MKRYKSKKTKKIKKNKKGGRTIRSPSRRRRTRPDFF